MKKNKITKTQIKYLLQALAILGLIVIFAYGSCLKLNFILIIVLVAAILIPFIIKAWVFQTKSVERFNILCNYLTNIIPIFLQRTKIRYTLGELYEICDGEMKEAILKAINYIDNTKDDPNLLENGLKLIEKDFPNSRVKSVHKFLLNVENTNSKDFKEIADNLYDDIEKWIKRTLKFQKDISDRRIKIIILCFITLVMNVLFVYIYVSNEYFKGFVDLLFYQISTTAFIVGVLFIVTVIIIKLNGKWLVNDIKNNKDEIVKERYRKYKGGVEKIGVIDIILTLLSLAASVYYFFEKNNNTIGTAFIVLALIFISQKYRRFIANKKFIKKELTIEFPIWLREVSLSLGSFTVLNAINESLDTVSYPMRRELRNFLDEANKNPTSIKPYNDFLEEYKIDEVKSSMRVLYAVNSASKDEMKIRTAKLIDRNQELLSKSEQITNDDSIGGVEMIGYLPTLIFSIQMVLSMMIMFDYMMEMLGGQIRI